MFFSHLREKGSYIIFAGTTKLLLRLCMYVYAYGMFKHIITISSNRYMYVHLSCRVLHELVVYIVIISLTFFFYDARFIDVNMNLLQ